ncbi:MAG: FtsW/RodA/SpoVE family cell cycle protein [Clostridia bacterium]|nr:FtsW/RodA/SpoVE family cell cycle protein [Clostridia bacterium]
MRKRSLHTGSIVSAILLFEITAFAILAIGSSPFDLRIPAIAVGAIGMFLFQYGTITAFFPGCDRPSLLIVNFLAAIGLIMQTRINAEYAIRQLLWMGIGMVGMVVALVGMRRLTFWRKTRIPFIALSLVLLAATLVFGSEQYGATNWIKLGGFTVQPSEFVKIMTVFVLASLLDRGKSVPKMLLALFHVGACMLLLLMAKDLGAVLLIAGTAIVMLYAATGSKLLLGLSFGTGAVGAAAAYKLFSHVRTRVAVWRNPWADYHGSGYQIVQGLIGIASGGLFGLGLTRGAPGAIPVVHADYIFAAICQEFGLIFGLIVIGFYLVFVVRGVLIAMDSRNSFDALVAVGCATLICLQSFIIIAGVCKLLPLTGITMPFASYGGSSLLSCYLILGVLQGIAIKNNDIYREEFEDVYDRLEADEDDEWEDDE